MAELLFTLFKVFIFSILITLAYSVFYCVTTDTIFMKSDRNKTYSYIPGYNLLIMLDIVKLSRIYIALLLLPVTNIIIFILIAYRLGVMYNLTTAQKVGLIILPIIYLPYLNYFIAKNNDVKNSYEDISDQMVTLLTDSELKELNNSIEDEAKIDNVFKAPVIEMQNIPAFKANRNIYSIDNPRYENKNEITNIEVTNNLNEEVKVVDEFSSINKSNFKDNTLEVANDIEGLNSAVNEEVETNEEPVVFADLSSEVKESTLVENTEPVFNFNESFEENVNQDKPEEVAEVKVEEDKPAYSYSSIYEQAAQNSFNRSTEDNNKEEKIEFIHF